MKSLLHYHRGYPALENEWVKWSNKYFPSVICCILSTLSKLSLPFSAKMKALVFLKERAANLCFLKVKGSFLHRVNINCNFYWECFLGWERKLLHVLAVAAGCMGERESATLIQALQEKVFPFPRYKHPQQVLCHLGFNFFSKSSELCSNSSEAV